MRVAELLNARLVSVERLLCLPPGAAEVLRLVSALDLDTASLLAASEQDEARREGVVSWAVLLEALPALSPEALSQAVGALAGWGLLTVVGASPGDVQIPGTAALRLCHAGRLALGLAPCPPLPAPAAAPLGWRVLHGANRERLMAEAEGALGGPVRPTRLGEDVEAAIAGLTGALLAGEGAVVEALGGPPEGVVASLIRRTPQARAPRVLLLSEPRPARRAALAHGATLRWVPDLAEAGGGAGIDPRLTASLLASQPGSARADVCGMPASALARPRRVTVAWEDLELPQATAHRVALARQHAAARLSGGVELHNSYGRPGGYRLLLCGLPGTGKSLTAAALASSLDRLLVKIDLSSVLSKWLGETEKLLGEIFDLAEASGALLVLDEAEALFKQRSSGAGTGAGLATAVAFLLGRLDDYAGVLVATTNRLEDIDEAFYRRFDDLIALPMPDATTRARLWTRHLGAALSPENLAFLSESFAVSGGLIEGASLRARAWALEAGGAPTVVQVLASLALELEKSGRSGREIFTGAHGAEVRALLEGR